MASPEDALREQLGLITWLNTHQPTFKEFDADLNAWTVRAFKTALELGETFYWSSATMDLALTASTQLPIPSWPVESHLFAPEGFAYFEDILQVEPVTEEYANDFSHDEYHSMSWTKSSEPPDTLWLIINEGSLCSFIPVPLLAKDQALLYADKKRFWNWWPYIALFVAMNSFVHQRLLKVSRQRLNRAARRRMAREGVRADPVVSVVTLRLTDYLKPQNGSPQDVEWSCQWMVRGHWRKQWYSSLERHQPIWITPYVKGPEDKPLKKPGANIFAVVR